jgi:hypothetical protein
MMRMVQRPFAALGVLVDGFRAGSPLRLKLALNDPRVFGELGVILDLLPVARVRVDDEIVPGKDALFHLGHDLGQGEWPEIQVVLLDQPALVFLGNANGIGNAERLAQGQRGVAKAGSFFGAAWFERIVPTSAMSWDGRAKRVSGKDANPRSMILSMPLGKSLLTWLAGQGGAVGACPVTSS